MQMKYSYVSDLPFENFRKLARQAETIKNYRKQVLVRLSIVWETHKLTQSKQFSYITCPYRKKRKSLRVQLARADIVCSQREIKEIFDPEKLTFSINSEHKRPIYLLKDINCS